MNDIFSTLLHLLSLGSFGPNPDLSTGFHYRRINENAPQEEESGRMGLLSVARNALAQQNLSTIDLLTSTRFGKGKQVTGMTGREAVAPNVQEDYLSELFKSAVVLLNSKDFPTRGWSRFLSILLMLPIVPIFWMNLLFALAFQNCGCPWKHNLFAIVTIATTAALLAAIVDSFLQLPEDTLEGQIVAGLILFGTVAAGLGLNLYILEGKNPTIRELIRI